MRFRFETQGYIARPDRVEFKEIKQYRANFVDHRLPGFRLDDKAGRIVARRDPDMRLVVPARVNVDRRRHIWKIGAPEHLVKRG